jgi:hypothetical protein
MSFDALEAYRVDETAFRHGKHTLQAVTLTLTTADVVLLSKGLTFARHFYLLKDTTIIRTAHRASSDMQPTVITQRVCCRHTCTFTERTNVGATQCHKTSAGKHLRPQLVARATVEQDNTSTEASRAEARRMRRETRDATDTTVDINPVSVPEQL